MNCQQLEKTIFLVGKSNVKYIHIRPTKHLYWINNVNVLNVCWCLHRGIWATVYMKQYRICIVYIYSYYIYACRDISWLCKNVNLWRPSPRVRWCEMWPLHIDTLWNCRFSGPNRTSSRSWGLAVAFRQLTPDKQCDIWKLCAQSISIFSQFPNKSISTQTHLSYRSCLIRSLISRVKICVNFIDTCEL